MKKLHSLLSVAVLATLTPAAAAQTATLLPGATGRAISRDGVASTGWFNGNPFLWTKANGFTALTGNVYNPRAVADQGAVVVGMVDDPVTLKQSSGYWESGTGQWISLGQYQGNNGCPGYGEALDVTPDGSTIGGELFIGCNLFAYTWTLAGGYVALPKSGGFATCEGLSEDGLLAGGWDTHPSQGSRRAALWDAAQNETFPLISAANPTGRGEINVLNSDGSIYAGMDDAGLGAFIYRNGTFTPLGVPQNIPRPSGLSEDGSVVVGSYGNIGVGYNAWVWNECDGYKSGTQFFTDQGVVFPAGFKLTRMFGVSRDGTKFLGGYEGAGTGAVYIELPGNWQAATYCTAKLNSQGCAPSICATGLASLSQPIPYMIRVHGNLNNKPGLLFYSITGAANVPFLGGTLCVASPIRRTGVQASSGNPPPDDCSGNYAFDFNAYAQSGVHPALVAGVTVFGQYWSRDPAHVDGTGMSLTDALMFQLHP